MSLLIMCSKLLVMSSLENSKIKSTFTVLDQEYTSVNQENKTLKCERGLSQVLFRYLLKRTDNKIDPLKEKTPYVPIKGINYRVQRTVGGHFEP